MNDLIFRLLNILFLIAVMGCSQFLPVTQMWKIWIIAAAVVMVLLNELRAVFRADPPQKSPEIRTDNPRYKNDLEIAKRVQQALLSVEHPHIDGIVISRRCMAAESVGGDFYTFVHRNGQEVIKRQKIQGVTEFVDSREQSVGIIIGDVAGHGVSSALVMALSSGILGELAKTNRSPGQMLKKANAEMIRYLENSIISHITVFYGLIQIKTKTLLYARGGHPPLILVHPDGSCQILDCDGVFLGVFEHEDYEECEMALQSGDRLVFYTDGLIEARNAADDMFGVERLTDLLRKYRDLPSDLVEDRIFHEVSEFSGKSPGEDDQTMVIVDIL